MAKVQEKSNSDKDPLLAQFGIQTEDEKREIREKILIENLGSKGIDPIKRANCCSKLIFYWAYSKVKVTIFKLLKVSKSCSIEVRIFR